MSLVKSLGEAKDFTSRTLSLSRASTTKAAGDMSRIVADALTGVAVDRREDISTAAAQYQNNRGWVFAAVDLIAQRVAGQRVCVSSDRDTAGSPLRTTKAYGDDREPLESHPLLNLLAAPNSIMSGNALIYSTVASLELCGRALWWIVTTPDNELSILPVPASWIVKTDADHTKWEIRIPGAAKTREIPADETVYFFRPDPGDPWGHTSPLSAISEAVSTDKKISEAQYAVFSRGPWPSHAVTVGKQPAAPGTGPAMRPHLTPEQRQQIITAIMQAYSGFVKYGKPLILDGMIESVERLTLTPDELQFLESSKVTKEKILQCYRTSPILLGQVEGANRASATVADEIFCSSKVNPIIACLSDAMTRFLAPRFSADGEKLTVWIEPARARDDDGTFRRWQFALQSGAVTVDEFRCTVLNLPPRPPEEKEATLQDVQAAALNGAQIASLVQIAQLVGDGTLTRDAARAIIVASFPSLSDDKIEAIVSALEVNVAPEVAALVKSLNPYTMKRLGNGEIK